MSHYRSEVKSWVGILKQESSFVFQDISLVIVYMYALR